MYVQHVHLKAQVHIHTRARPACAYMHAHYTHTQLPTKHTRTYLQQSLCAQVLEFKLLQTLLFFSGKRRVALLKVVNIHRHLHALSFSLSLSVWLTACVSHSNGCLSRLCPCVDLDVSKRYSHKRKGYANNNALALTKQLCGWVGESLFPQLCTFQQVECVLLLLMSK